LVIDDKFVVKITDFGMSRLMPQTQTALTSSTHGGGGGAATRTTEIGRHAIIGKGGDNKDNGDDDDDDDDDDGRESSVGPSSSLTSIGNGNHDDDTPFGALDFGGPTRVSDNTSSSTSTTAVEATRSSNGDDSVGSSPSVVGAVGVLSPKPQRGGGVAINSLSTDVGLVVDTTTAAAPSSNSNSLGNSNHSNLSNSSFHSSLGLDRPVFTPEGRGSFHSTGAEMMYSAHGFDEDEDQDGDDGDGDNGNGRSDKEYGKEGHGNDDSSDLERGVVRFQASNDLIPPPLSSSSLLPNAPTPNGGGGYGNDGGMPPKRQYVSDVPGGVAMTSNVGTVKSCLKFQCVFFFFH
jgi:hypothetical protein